MKFPEKCPYCGKDIVQEKVGSISHKENNFYNKTYVYKCMHCLRGFTLVDIGDDRKKNLDYSLVFPPTEPISIPKKIQDLSPKAYKTYQQVILAKNSGYDMLIGAGLRIALEWLIWDYLIKIKGKTEGELEKLKLYKRIELMCNNFYIDVCTRLIRLFGNDSVHIIKQLDFSVNEVIQSFEMLCALINSELIISETNAKLNASSPNTPKTHPTS